MSDYSAQKFIGKLNVSDCASICVFEFRKASATRLEN